MLERGEGCWEAALKKAKRQEASDGEAQPILVTGREQVAAGAELSEDVQ